VVCEFVVVVWFVSLWFVVVWFVSLSAPLSSSSSSSSSPSTSSSTSSTVIEPNAEEELAETEEDTTGYLWREQAAERTKKCDICNVFSYYRPCSCGCSQDICRSCFLTHLEVVELE